MRFHEYRMQDDHRDTVSEALSELPPESFRWVPRRNRATKHPTDFGLLEIQPGSEAAVKVAMPGTRLGFSELLPPLSLRAFARPHPSSPSAYTQCLAAPHASSFSPEALWSAAVSPLPNVLLMPLTTGPPHLTTMGEGHQPRPAPNAIPRMEA